MDCFPLLNTVFLVYSGIFLMNSINYLKKGNFKFSFLNLIFTILLGFFFVAVQFFEYSESSFSFNDSCYGSVFFLLTGFHGFHVIVGLVFLIICAFRLYFTAKFNVFKKNKKISYYNILVTNYCIYSKFNFYLVQKNLMKNISKDSSLISSISKKLSMDYFLTKTNSNFKWNSMSDLRIIEHVSNWVLVITFYLNLFNFLNSKKTYLDVKYNNLLSKRYFYFINFFFNKYYNISNVSFKKNLNIVDWSFGQVKNSRLAGKVNGSFFSEIYLDKIVLRSCKVDIVDFINNFKREVLHEILLSSRGVNFYFAKEFISNNKLVNAYNNVKNIYVGWLRDIYRLDLISYRSKKFYSWKRILLWINYNNLNVSNSDFSFLRFISRRVETRFILPFIGFKRDSNVGYICASWYWHFVDAIWLVVISVIYSDFLLAFIMIFIK